jgi:hypothetical protein
MGRMCAGRDGGGCFRRHARRITASMKTVIPKLLCSARSASLRTPNGKLAAVLASKNWTTMSNAISQ